MKKPWWAWIPTLALLASANPARAATSVTKCETIKTSGSYVLKKSLTSKTSGSDCITINASNVTLDLAGYNIQCGSPLNGNGVVTGTGLSGITIRNGFVANCGNGINTAGLDGLAATGVLIDEVVTLSSSLGIDVGENSTVIHSISNGNSYAGIFAWCPANILYNTAVNNNSPQPNDLVYTGTTPCHFSCNAYDLGQILGTVGSCP